MESAEVRACSFRKPPHTPAPAGSQLCRDVQTETCTDSGGEISGSGGHINPMDQQNHVKKDEPEDEGYVCEAAPGPVGHIIPVDEQIYIKKEEPEDEEYLCGETSGFVENVDQEGGFQSLHVKEEESKDEDYICTTTVLG
ncbi:hypothetical protein AMELA_G00283260 [Ameiurus melas]|uniref:Uncharacterized protein n=1 Tax=Ameiurus melas TaxID=219545 RepID=A0A7J5ZL68_AMEME|nr:hypothetical protein AMELA_G00283260 [Ameiurus melas]